MSVEKIPEFTMKLSTYSNSTLACFNFSRFDVKQVFPPHGGLVSKGLISLRATCGYNGFLDICIPRNWLDGNFTVLIDYMEVNPTITMNSTHCSLYITYEKGSHIVEIIGMKAGNIIGDLNGDGVVNLYDLTIVGSLWDAEE
jgi:hypothetical protein